MDLQAQGNLLERVKESERRGARLRLGEVDSTAPLSVALGGSDVPYADVARLEGASLAPGDLVACLLSGNDLLVLGPITRKARAGSFDVTHFGAVGDGVTDDTAAIQAAVDAAAAVFGEVYFPPGAYLITEPIVLPRGVRLRGTQMGLWKIGDDEQTCYLLVDASFSGSAAILINDKTLAGESLDTSMIQIEGLGIDGDTVGSVHGIHARGHVRNVRLREVDIRRPGGNGIKVEDVSGRRAQEWYFDHVFVHGCGASGIITDDLVDGSFNQTHVSDCAGHGFHLKSLSNYRLVGCSSEHNTAGCGYAFDNGTNYAPGNVEMVGCSTDRNDDHGLWWACQSSQNNKALMISGCRFRRDGRNGNSGGGGFAGIFVEGASGTPALPVLISGVSMNVGVDDDGSGTDSPQYGLKATYALHVQVTGGQLWGNTAGWNDAGNNSTIHIGPGVRQISGVFTSPTSSVKWVYLPGGAVLATDTTNSYIDMPEITTPGNSPANFGRFFMRDSGAGKTEMRFRGPSGVTQLIAVEP